MNLQVAQILPCQPDSPQKKQEDSKCASRHNTLPNGRKRTVWCPLLFLVLIEPVRNVKNLGNLMTRPRA
jgi:hypothetical protein